MTERASMRVAYGKALADLGEVNPKVVVLDADVSASTQSHFFAARFGALLQPGRGRGRDGGCGRGPGTGGQGALR